jgi:hypothetical protein
MNLNNICNAIGNHSGAFKDIKDASMSSVERSSHANRNRNSELAEDLF